MRQDRRAVWTGALVLVVMVAATAAASWLMPNLQWQIAWWAAQGFIIACAASWLHGRTSGQPGYFRGWVSAVGRHATRRSSLAFGIPVLLLLLVFALLPDDFGSGRATEGTNDYQPKFVVRAIPREVVALDQYHTIAETQYFIREDRGPSWRFLNRMQPPPKGEQWHSYYITIQARSPEGEVATRGIGLRLVADNGRSYMPEAGGTINSDEGFAVQRQAALLRPAFRLPDDVKPVYLEIIARHRDETETFVIARKPTPRERAQLADRIRRLGDAHGRGRDSGQRDAVPVPPDQRRSVPEVPSLASSMAVSESSTDASDTVL